MPVVPINVRGKPGGLRSLCGAAPGTGLNAEGAEVGSEETQRAGRDRKEGGKVRSWKTPGTGGFLTAVEARKLLMVCDDAPFRPMACRPSDGMRELAPALGVSRLGMVKEGQVQEWEAACAFASNSLNID